MRTLSLLMCASLISCGMSASCARDEKKTERPSEAVAKPAEKTAKTAKTDGEDAERARINALLGAGPGKLSDPSLKTPGLTPAPTAKVVSQKFVVVGVAKNAKSGAIVDRDGTVYYVAGLMQWPDKLHGKRVEVTGTVAKAKLAPDPVVGADGAVSAGMKGMSTVINDAKYRLAP